MPKLKDITNLWKNVGELDLRPLAEAAQKMIKISIVGTPGVGRHTLADQLRTDPARPQNQTQTPVVISDLQPPDWVEESEVIILMLDATAKDFSREQALATQWVQAHKKVLVFANKIDLLGPGQVLQGWNQWQTEHLVYGSAKDPASLAKTFVPAVLEMTPNQHLALGRQFPLFRVPIAHELIDDTCFSNAAYSFSTGLAEIIPVLDIPLNVADMVVLTKAQAFLVYKLGLEFGFSVHWQDYVTEFGSVVGGGFMWRQLARSLIGLIPVWGIVPKVAVAYAGTYVVGNAILQWYLTGRKLSRAQMRDIYAQAIERGKAFAQQLAAKAPRPRFGRRKAALPAPAGNACPNCSKINAPDARYCQYCGLPIVPSP